MLNKLREVNAFWSCGFWRRLSVCFFFASLRPCDTFSIAVGRGRVCRFERLREPADKVASRRRGRTEVAVLPLLDRECFATKL